MQTVNGLNLLLKYTENYNIVGQFESQKTENNWIKLDYASGDLFIGIYGIHFYIETLLLLFLMLSAVLGMCY